MNYPAVLRVALSLLIAALQVTGSAVAIGPTQSPDTTTYFCCCVGECSCTGDCCNHGPVEGSDKKTPGIRIGAAGPTLEAPRSCGAWRATLQRGPDQGKVIVDDSGSRSTAPPASPRLRQFQKTPTVSPQKGLQSSSPRAPPA